MLLCPIVHGLLEVDRIEDLDPVRLINDLAVFVLHRLASLAQLGRTTLEHLTALHQNGSLRNSFVKIENGSITDNFHFRNWRLLHRHASGVSPYLPACPCSPC